ncbi:MAG: lipopolysaccharide export system permease protein [Chlamydiales bacterium]|jgi:lipopolysaccharide export system permease protein
MPIIWRFLLSQFFKVFLLSLFSFIAVLLVTRLDEVAQFAAIGAPIKLIFLFTLYQVLYVLPIAIPIACLIASIILFQNISHTHELTALRSSGLGLRHITTPILVAGTVIALLNFYIISEWATRSHLYSKEMINELKSINPLLLLQNKQILKLQEAYVDIGSLYSGEVAHDVVIVINNRNTHRLNLMSAKKLNLSNSVLYGEHVSLISSLAADDPHTYDHLVIENQDRISTPSDEFSQLLKTSGWRLNNDHLQLPLLLIRAKKEYQQMLGLKATQPESPMIEDVNVRLNRCFSEIARRASASIAALTFVLMGAAFGINIGRTQSKKGPLSVIALAALFLCSFFAARSFENSFMVSAAFYTLPHVIIVFLSIRTLKNVTRGVE